MKRFSGRSSRKGRKCEKEMTTGRGGLLLLEGPLEGPCSSRSCCCFCCCCRLRVSDESCGSLSESKNSAKASPPSSKAKGSSPGGQRQALKSV